MNMVISCLKKHMRNFITKYIFDDVGYIFRNALDAALGLIVLLVIPIISIFLTFSETHTFLNYGFPLIAIMLAEIYDAYGRIDDSEIKNRKLNCRILAVLISFVAMIISFILKGIFYLPSLILIINASILTVEIILRIITAMRFSKVRSKIKAKIEKHKNIKGGLKNVQKEDIDHC